MPRLLKKCNCLIFKPFRLIKKPETKNIKPKVKGKKIFQPKIINWSNRYRGKLALTKINKKTTKTTFKLKINSESNP